MSQPSLPARLIVAVLVGYLALPPAARANPNGGVVRAGRATITGEGTARVDINQQSQGAVLSWQGFDINAGEVTNFNQPNANAVALNRIFSNNASQILGSLNANGHVYLINPNGVIFGAGAQVNAHALTAATSLDAENLAAQSGGFDPSAVSAPGASVVNHGTLRAGDGGFVYLVAPKVENGQAGVITAPNGEVHLEAGATVYLTDGLSPTRPAIAYTAPAGSEAVNLGRLVADGGLVRVKAAVLTQGGVIEANAVRENGGKIELYADNQLNLSAGSSTSARGSAEGISAGGVVEAYSAGDAVMERGATIDVSGGAQGGDGGSAELSAAHDLAVAGELRGDAAAGSRGGQIELDPETLQLADGASFSAVGGRVTAEADKLVTVAANTTVRLQDTSPAGATDPNAPTFLLRSGRHIVFEQGASIQDDGSGGRNWNVEVVAGADMANADPTALDPTSDGGLYLSGATVDPSSYDVTAIGTNHGAIALTNGDLTVRTAGDVVIGNGGGLQNVRGKIDVQAGIAGSGHGSVLFTASDPNAPDGVIENGSGAISVVAEDSVRLRISNTAIGNAAIRTRGTARLDADGNPTLGRERGGDIFILARNGDVDAGVGNRWVEGGPAFPADLGAFDPYYATVLGPIPAFDVLPVVKQGILGIGAEAGGNVTVIAGRDVVTDNTAQPSYSGATASELGTQYNASRIGIFGQETFEPQYIDPANDLFGFGLRQPVVPVADAPQNRLTVVAGGNITGNYMVRNGTAVLRAGVSGLDQPVNAAFIDAALAAVPGADAFASIDRHALAVDWIGLHPEGDGTVGDARLSPSVHVTADVQTETQLESGWVGTLARPITVDLVHGSVDARADHGMAVRAIENPSLVYPPTVTVNGVGDRRAPSYGEQDLARLEVERGDVLLVGNGAALPILGDPRPAVNKLVWLLPPSLSVKTSVYTLNGVDHAGDLVLLNDFELAPSHTGGLALDVAGQVRSAGVAATGHAAAFLSGFSFGSAGDESFSVPAGALVRDTKTGVEYTLSTNLDFAPRLPPLQSQSAVTVTLTPGGAANGYDIPIGTRFESMEGQVFETVSAQRIPAESERYSQGTVTFFLSQPLDRPVLIPQFTDLVAADGTRFRTPQAATIQAGLVSLAVPVIAEGSGFDVAARALQLTTPIQGVAFATNLRPTFRPDSFDIAVVGVVLPPGGSALAKRVTRFLDPIPDAISVTNKRAISGRPAGPYGFPHAPGSESPVSSFATTEVVGPLGVLTGASLELVPGAPIVSKSGDVIDPSLIQLSVTDSQGDARLVQVLYRQQRYERDANGTIVGTRPDPGAGELALVGPDDAWTSDATGATLSRSLRQSDAAPEYDSRNPQLFDFFLDYATYYKSCHSGSDCISLGLRVASDPRLGTRPTHADDRTPSVLRAAQGFDGVRLDIAKAASLWSGRDVVDLSLQTQHSDPSDLTVVDIPNGSLRLGQGTHTLVDNQLGVPREVTIRDDGNSGIQVSGPGHAEVLVGVMPWANADSPEYGGNGDGRISFDEFSAGAPADQISHLFDVFRGLDARGLPSLSLGDDFLTQAESPWVPWHPPVDSPPDATYVSRPREIQLANVPSVGGSALGLESAGNLRGDMALPAHGADLDIVSLGDIHLNGSGSITTLQGGDLFVQSLGGGLFGGDPQAAANPPKRGIVSVYAELAGPLNPVLRDTGGGKITIDTHGDFDIGQTAVTSQSGGDISIASRFDSAIFGVGGSASGFQIFYDPNSPLLTFQGAGAAAKPPANVTIDARKDIDIGAGITANNLNINAGGSLVSSGSGGISVAGNANVSAGGTISGSISAGGSVTVGSGTVTSGFSASAGGLVTGAGSVGSNAGGGKVSNETSLMDDANKLGGSFVRAAEDDASRKGVIINVASRPLDDDELKKKKN